MVISAQLSSKVFPRRPTHPTRRSAGKVRGAIVLLILHVIPLTLLWTGTRNRDWAAFGIMYVVMIFGVGAGLHRYFAHRSFKTGRSFQLLLAAAAGTALGNPIGFIGKHRLHHKYSDTPHDVHSPKQGFWYCWIGSLLDEGCSEAEILAMAPDLTVQRELRWLHRYFYAPAAIAAAAMYAIGGYTMFATGFCLSFVAVLHATSAVNYFCHRGTNRRYPTSDDSTNRPLLSVLILGEGWHHNHHYYPASARCGFRWYEFDFIYYALRILAWMGIVWDLKDVPENVRRGRRNTNVTCSDDDASVAVLPSAACSRSVQYHIG